jgi:hypothetical protein
MQRAKSIVAVLMAIPLAGCFLKGKQVTPAPAPVKPVAKVVVTPPPQPPPLSIPQTHAQLPAPQPIPEEALATAVPVEEETHAPLAQPVKPPPRRPTTRAGPPPVEIPGATQPVAPEPERPQIQENLPPEQQTQLREQANASRREIQQLVARVPRPNRQQRDVINRINGLLKQSEDREGKGDQLAAKQLAERALVLARGLR